MTEKTNRTQQMREGRHLHAVPELRRPRYGLRRAGAAALVALALAGGAKGVDMLTSWARAENEATANNAPDPEDVCVVIGEGGSPRDIVPRVFGDEFADGTDDIVEISDDASAVLAAHPGDGVAVCRDPNSDKLNANYVASPEKVESGQRVSIEEFDDAGGVSHDVTLGR